MSSFALRIKNEMWGQRSKVRGQSLVLGGGGRSSLQAGSDSEVTLSRMGSRPRSLSERGGGNPRVGGGGVVEGEGRWFCCCSEINGSSSFDLKKTKKERERIRRGEWRKERDRGTHVSDASFATFGRH